MDTCCDKPDIQNEIYKNGDWWICQNCCQLQDDPQDYIQCRYSPPYQIRHHVTEVLKRLEGDEPNKPSINKEIFQGDYSLENIWRKGNRKHITYIYSQLNELHLPIITREEKETILRIMHRISKKCYGKKLPPYNYIIAKISEKLEYTHIRPFIYIPRENSKHDKIMIK